MNLFHPGAGYIYNKNLTVQAGRLRQVDFLKERELKKNDLFTSLAVKL